MTNENNVASKRHRLLIWSASFSLLLAIGMACGGESYAPRSIDVPMLEVNNSGQSGNAVLRSTSLTTSEAHIRLNVSGAAYSDGQKVYIYTGTCDNLGEQAYRIKDILYGESEPPTKLKVALDALQTGNYVINAHLTDAASSPSTACGAIPALA